jgi:hypothetical protein
VTAPRYDHRDRDATALAAARAEQRALRGLAVAAATLLGAGFAGLYLLVAWLAG